MLRLGHLNLAVSDLDRSAQFYARWFGFDQTLAQYADGTRFLTDGSGFELALQTRERTHESGDWHFGFLATDAETVRNLAQRMAQEAIRVADPEDDSDYVGFKCTDPDGHTIEVYFEPR